MKWWGILPVLFFLAVTPAAALTLNFSNTPSSVDENQEFSIDVSLSCSSCSDSYLRGVFFSSSTNYFGYTKNNSGTWINLSGSQATQYFLVAKNEVKEGNWSGKLVVKPDPADSAFTGPGNYNFKVGRYTSGGSVTWAAAVPISISGPAPTSVPVPTSRPPTAAPSPLPTSIPTLVPTLIPTSTIIDTTEVLAATTSSDLISSPAPLSPDPPKNPGVPIPAIIVIAAGILICLGALILPF